MKKRRDICRYADAALPFTPEEPPLMPDFS